MQANWKKILVALGCDLTNPEITKEQPCPLHPHGEHTLVIRDNPCTGSLEFHCNYPRCSFSGDAISLTARTKHITLEKAVNLFREDGELHHTIAGEFSDEQLNEYIQNRDSQARISAYINTCRQALRQSDRGYQAQDKLAIQGVLHPATLNVPTGLGLLVQDDLPPALREFEKLKYKKGCYVVYPYTYNGQITQIRIQNLDNMTVDKATFGITGHALGIFLEENIAPTTEEIYITKSELSALSVVRTMADVSDHRFPVICTAGFPLPYRYHNVKRVFLLSTEEAPLDLKTALEYFAAEELVAGASDVKVYTLPLRTPIKQLRAQQLKMYTEATHRFSLHSWLIREF